MAKISQTGLLKERIRLLEIQQAEEGKMVKEELRSVYQNLNPINLIKNSVKKLATSDELKSMLFENCVALISGLLTKKILTSDKSHPIIKLLASLLQLGATNLAANYKDVIVGFLSGLIGKIYTPQEEAVKEPEA
jgi:hypothetical protein